MREAVNGILLLNKPKGLSSNAVLQRVKRLFNAKKAGHTGSLDPLATGMLPICFGEATKFSQYLLDADKAYDVKGILGTTTDTGDAEGKVLATIENFPHISEAQLDAVLCDLTGQIGQVPPMYSALKHQGKPLYTYARRGEEIARKTRNVSIYELKCIDFTRTCLHLTVTCSKGTYVRTLIESIGEALNVGAYVSDLHRIYTAGFETEPMITLETLEKESREAHLKRLLPVDRAVMQFPRFDLNDTDVVRLKQGKTIELTEKDLSGIVRLYASAEFIGLGEVLNSEEIIKVKRLLATI